jgi:hypothetical protein
MRYFLATFLVLFVVTCSVAAKADDLMPKIAYLSEEDMQEMLCPSGQCLEIVAFYDNDSKTIVLREGFDPTKEYDLSILLHEFVHHLQNINGMQPSRCRGDRERQAYEVQRTFLKERGHKDKVMGIDMFTQFIITQCGE